MRLLREKTNDIADGLSRMDVDINDADSMVNDMRNLSMQSQKMMQTIYDSACAKLRPMVISFLQQNLASSGLKSKTGKLRRAVSNAIVEIKISRGAPKIIIAMPVGVDPYKGGSDFYQAAASNNYGAVHAAGHVGAKARQTIKRYALTGKISDRARMAVETAYYHRASGTVRQGHTIGRRRAGKGFVLVGRDVVIPPRKFFYLTGVQKQRLITAFLQTIENELGVTKSKVA